MYWKYCLYFYCSKTLDMMCSLCWVWVTNIYLQFNEEYWEISMSLCHFLQYFHNRSVHWSLSDKKSPQVSRALLNIKYFTCSQQCWCLILPLISCSFCPLSESLQTIPRVPTMIGITVTFMFHSDFNSLARIKYWSIVSFSFIFHLTASYFILFILFFCKLG